MKLLCNDNDRTLLNVRSISEFRLVNGILDNIIILYIDGKRKCLFYDNRVQDMLYDFDKIIEFRDIYHA